MCFSFRYRDYGVRGQEAGKITDRIGEFLMFLGYWWFMHNLLYDPGHIFVSRITVQ